ncbi:hypothetical protein OIU78_015925 [Salix suchowensis]|nr:hypothetical protein OIU78_015925 [Salix suchowensis]
MSVPPSVFTIPAATDTSGGNKTSPFQNLNSSILIIILILSITLLVSVSLCFLLRVLNRRCLSHLSPSRTTATATTTTAFSSSNRHSGNNNHRVSPETSEPSIADSLPLFSFSSIKRRSSSSPAISGGDCAVCLSKFEPDDLLRLLPLCCHAFHAHCIDTWVNSNQSCPLCRSPIHISESDLAKAISECDGRGGDSFRLEIGSISRREHSAPNSASSLSASAASIPAGDHRSSYSVGSFDYVVEEESEVTISQSHRRSMSKESGGGGPTLAEQQILAEEVAATRGSWLREYVDRLSTSLSSRTASFRGSGRFFTGSSRRSELTGVGDYDLEANRVGEEISELFRWFSGSFFGHVHSTRYKMTRHADKAPRE